MLEKLAGIISHKDRSNQHPQEDLRDVDFIGGRTDPYIEPEIQQDPRPLELQALARTNPIENSNELEASVQRLKRSVDYREANRHFIAWQSGNDVSQTELAEQSPTYHETFVVSSLMNGVAKLDEDGDTISIPRIQEEKIEEARKRAELGMNKKPKPQDVAKAPAWIEWLRHKTRMRRITKDGKR